MSLLFETVSRLTSGAQMPHPELILQDFSQGSGWHPSYSHQTPNSSVARTHLLVEHGLQNTAVLSFLHNGRTYESLDSDSRSRLLSLSYNNLVDWHLAIERDRVHYLYNRSEKNVPILTREFSHSDTDALRVEAFEEISRKRPQGHLRSLDDALISTISTWKRRLSGELERDDINLELSTLFNSIIFARALEDTLKGDGDRRAHEFALRALSYGEYEHAKQLMERVLSGLTDEGTRLERILNLSHLDIFRNLGRDTIQDLALDFYINRFAARYEYDFSVISSHALSRIYERYVSLLKLPDRGQPTLFSPLADEVDSSNNGSVYTPQFIARFFARYIQNHVTPAMFRRMRSIDPACGSGIFLRSILELQCEPTRTARTTAEVQDTFSRVWGIDSDSNAVQASTLSLALLHLVLTRKLPPPLQVINSEALELLGGNEYQGAFDLVLANPPYIKYDEQSDDLRVIVANTLEPTVPRKPDTYLAFVKRGIELLAENGFACFVVPRSFLIGANAKQLRDSIRSQCQIHCVVDLSRIPVFQSRGAYVVLLIVQKRTSSPDEKAYMAECSDFAGNALQAVVDHQEMDTRFFSVKGVSQSWFDAPKWSLPHGSPAAFLIPDKFKRLGDVVSVRQGFVTGSDDVFIVPSDRVPPGGSALFVPFLRDRDINAYHLPRDSDLRVFMPYVGEVKLTEPALRDQFPEVYSYLESKRSELSNRRPVERGQLEWWEPARMRGPGKLLVPKIVTPHLMFLPKFALDSRGVFAVSHSPYMSNLITEDIDLLAYLTAILNSPFVADWLMTHSHRYNRGYALLEVAQMREAPIPDPARAPVNVIGRIVQLVRVNSRELSHEGSAAKMELSELVAELVKGL
jgi:hypothetical protein